MKPRGVSGRRPQPLPQRSRPLLAELAADPVAKAADAPALASLMLGQIAFRERAARSRPGGTSSAPPGRDDRTAVPRLLHVPSSRPGHARDSGARSRGGGAPQGAAAAAAPRRQCHLAGPWEESRLGTGPEVLPRGRVCLARAREVWLRLLRAPPPRAEDGSCDAKRLACAKRRT